MPAQETLTGPFDGGIWARYLDGGHINHGAWLRAVAEGSFVGGCRRCGDYLIPQRPEQRGDRMDYTATCRSEACGAEMAAPGGRILRRGQARSGRARRGAAVLGMAGNQPKAAPDVSGATTRRSIA